MFWGSKGRLPISSFLGGNAVAFAMFLLIEPPLHEAYSSVKTRPPPASADNHWIVFHLSVVRECYLRSSWCWWSFLCGDFKNKILKRKIWFSDQLQPFIRTLSSFLPHPHARPATVPSKEPVLSFLLPILILYFCHT